VCREASVRVLGLRHYDVQLIGGMVLHMGKIAEMRTGEGKTLVATLPCYLNALEGKGVHVVTVNDYLARRDAAQMGKLYTWLGLSVGVVWPGMDHADKREAYAADITYGTNNEFGFDYLRDNMAMSRADRNQRKLNYAIVDEVDSILIDEARTPLIISGPADDSPELYLKVNQIVPVLTRQATEEGEGDYWVDEKSKQVRSTPKSRCARPGFWARTMACMHRTISISCIISMPRCARTRCISVTITTSSAMARSSSSMNSPGAPCQGRGAGAA